MAEKTSNGTEADDAKAANPEKTSDTAQSGQKPKEVGGRNGPDPTRYGDWEKNGRCIDF